MARPKIYDGERTQLQVRLSKVVSNRLTKESARRMVSKSMLVEQALVEMLPKWEKQKT
jgi:predicted HicB family RNase H-like nuclease